MPLPTSRIYFARGEVQMILPALEALTNRLNSAMLGSFPVAEPMYFVEHPEICGTPHDRKMAAKVVRRATR